MTQSIGNKEFSSTTGRASKILILAAMAVLVVGCGGGDGDEPAARNTTSSGGSSLVDFLYGVGCFLVTNGQSGCLEDNEPTQPYVPVVNEPSPLVLSEVFDYWSNDSLSTATGAYFPTPLVPDQKIGFYVNGRLDNLTDGVDTFAFTAARSRTFTFRICRLDSTTADGYCNLSSSRGTLDVAIAYFSVLDQYGTVLLSSQGNTVNGNILHMRIDAGVLYYVMVIDEGDANKYNYGLRVFESITEPEADVLQEPDPNAPILSAGEVMSLTSTLDWIPPTMNVNGTPLLDLAGYNVYLGPESGMYLDFRHLDNPGLVTYVLDLPSSGPWFIVITALDSAGNESDFSNEVVVNVSDLPPPGEMP